MGVVGLIYVLPDKARYVLEYYENVMRKYSHRECKPRILKYFKPYILTPEQDQARGTWSEAGWTIIQN